MFGRVEGVFFMTQSWFRAQFDSKKLSKMNELQFLGIVPPQNQGQISLVLFRKVTTNYVTDISFIRRMVRKVEGIFFMTQSWFRAQYDSKKLSKMNEFQFLSLLPPQNQGQISLFIFKNVTTNYVTDVSFNMRMVRKVEGIFFMTQSWFRTQFDKKKLAKKNELHAFVSFFCKV